MPKIIHVTEEIQVPSLPSFLYSISLNRSIPIGDMDDEDLKKIGDEWTKELIKKATSLRKCKRPLFGE